MSLLKLLEQAQEFKESMFAWLHGSARKHSFY